jgi:hypothetical protein
MLDAVKDNANLEKETKEAKKEGHGPQNIKDLLIVIDRVGSLKNNIVNMENKIYNAYKL